jgi:hypothetical protein
MLAAKSGHMPTPVYGRIKGVTADCCRANRTIMAGDL